MTNHEQRADKQQVWHPNSWRSVAIGILLVAGSTARAGEFQIVPTDKTLLPVIVRWAQTDGLVAILNGRRVTTRSLRDEPYADLPLTAEARTVTGATAEQAIAAALRSYGSYRTDVEVTATFKPPYFVAITTRKATPVAVASQSPTTVSAQPAQRPQFPPSLQNTAAASHAPAAGRPTPPALQPPPPPPRIAATTAALVAYPTWDSSARKSAGVMSGTWLVGDSQSLRAVVEAWAKQSGFQVEWTSTRDYKVSDAIRASRYTGTFREALLGLAAAFGQLESPLGMTFVNKAGSPTLHVFDA
ncbi:TcpQ domain-containing protein [Variovorax sp. HW608]|uniref:TcpQ domain-containing protein n=1 Tax=Variovorax sp. HW608 TaxID=1034889 RepID=UPI0012FE50F2|nr:TcpQ domain-containing protein [Variovorax sp. HW608]